jgi:hypothetical protein
VGVRKRGEVAGDGSHKRQRREGPWRGAFPVHTPSLHEDRVRGDGQRTVVIEEGGTPRVFAGHADDVDGEPPAERVQPGGKRPHERAERPTVARAIVLEVEVEPRVGGVGDEARGGGPRSERDELRERARAHGGLGEQTVYDGAVLAAEARLLNELVCRGVGVDFGVRGAHNGPTGERTFEVGGVNHADRPNVGLQVGKGVGRARQQEGL